MKCVHCLKNYPTKKELTSHLDAPLKEGGHGGSANKVARTCISCPPPGNVFTDLEQHHIDVHGATPTRWPCRSYSGGSSFKPCTRVFSTPGKRNNHEFKDHTTDERREAGLVIQS